MSRVDVSFHRMAMVALGLTIGCSRAGEPGQETTAASTARARAEAIVAHLRGGPSAGLLGPDIAQGFELAAGGLRPRFGGAVPARLLLPARANAPFRLEEATAGLSVDVSLAGARDVPAATAGGYVVFAQADSSGATVLHRALPEGTEDLLHFEARPTRPEVTYHLEMGGQVAGLRLVAGTLELLDSSGTPRLRVATPYLVGADGARTEAALAVVGCAVDTSPAAPWGRPVVAPGARDCQVRVSWDDRRVAYPAVLDPRWTTTGVMTTARQDHSATLLSTGKVLVAGGRTVSSSGASTALSSAELYDPATKTWSATGSMSLPTASPRWSHTATQLPTGSNSNTSGRVLVFGGFNGSVSLATTQLYSVSAGTWAAGPSASAARHQHTATALASGKVVVAGGLTTTSSSSTTVLATLATYDPSGTGTGSWTTVAATMSSARRGHTATLLSTTNSTFNNKILIVGGNSTTSTTTGSLSTVQLFDPAAGTFATAAALPGACEGHTATALADGTVLIAGGKNGSTALASAQKFSFTGTTGAWVAAGSMTSARLGHTATLLPPGIAASGTVLVAGGNSGVSGAASGLLATANLWNGISTWTATTAMPAAVQGQTATPLPAGLILIAGGNDGTKSVTGAAVYDPSSGLGCTSNGQCATGFCANGVCCDTACNGGCGACNLTGKVGTCSPIASGTTCRASAGACDVAETCNGTAVTCPADGFRANGTACADDGNPCTTDQCNGASAACQHTASNAGAPGLDDGNPCTADTCDGAGHVTHTPVADFTPCDDGNVCTLGESCQAGVCKQPIQAACGAGNNVTFYQSYQQGDIAEITDANPNATISPPFIAAPGLFGQGMSGATTSELAHWTYAGASLSKPGSASYWFKTNDGHLPISLEMFDGYSQTNLFLVDEGTIGIGALLYYYQPGQTTQTVVAAVSGVPVAPMAGDGRWHLLVVNWSRESIGVSVDGAVPWNTPVSWLAPGHVFASTNIGALIYTGGSSYDGVADEPMILNRTMTPSEIQWYWNQGQAAAAAGNPNPAIAYFNGPANAPCDAWDDQQPCTADSCDPVSGVAHTPLAATTSCDDGNACNGAEFCDGAGACIPGTPLAIDDGNVCTADSCTYTAGAVHAPLDDGKQCIAGNFAVTPRLDGVVDAGNGSFIAVFGYDNANTSDVVVAPGAGLNAVSRNGGPPLANPNPEPPTRFLAGPTSHPGTFLPTFNAGETISWTVGGQTRTASASSTLLQTVPIGKSGLGVQLGSTLVTVKADDQSFLDPPDDPGEAPEPTFGLPEFPGTLKGELTISPSGAAVYNVPIALPPGIAGMAPNLALVYSSQAGSGIAGQGWELTGLSMIHRCPTTRPSDGVAHPVTMTGPAPGDDGLCLDGKRLFDRGPTADGTGERYELEMTDFSDITSTPDPLSPDGSTFTVVTKTGETRYYGMDDTTRVRLPGTFANNPTADGRTTAIWLLKEVVDVWGNEYEILYNKDKSDFETSGILISQIKYTGRLAGSETQDGASPVPAFQIVNFGYESRPDIRRARFRSGTIPQVQRLKTIDTGAGVYTLDYGQPSNPPTVDDRMLPSLLHSIKYCPATGACAQPLTFDWDGGGYDWQEVPDYKLPADITPSSGTQFMDLDGDGRLDVVSLAVNGVSKAWRNTGTGFEPTPQPWSLPGSLAPTDDNTAQGNTAFADLDGDGLLDALNLNPFDPTCPFCTPTPHVSVWYNRIRTAGQWSSRGAQIPSSVNSWLTLLHFGDTGTLIDIDGDGRADIVSMASGSNEPMRVLINTGENGGNLVFEDASGLYGGVTPIKEYDLRDLNRDGLPDLVGRFGTNSAGKAYLNTGVAMGGRSTVWAGIDVETIPGSLPKDLQSTADFDGDGLYDYIQYGCRAVYQQCEVLGAEVVPFTSTFGLSTGLGYDVPPSSDRRAAALQAFTPPFEADIRMEDYAFIPVDLNADGLADLVQHKRLPPGPVDANGFPASVPDDTVGRLLFNTGDTFRDLSGYTNFSDDPPVAQRPTPVPRVPRANRLSGDPHSTFIDLDGDGVTDLASTTTAWRNTFRPPVISGFPNGLAAKSVPTYKVITTAQALNDTDRPGHPTYANTSVSLASGTALLTTPLRVVAALATDDGIGGTATTNYEYRDLRASPSGRGPQGFATVIVSAPEDTSQPIGQRTRIATTTSYIQQFPYTGLPSQVKRALVDSMTGNQLALLSVTTTNYCDAMPGSGNDCTEQGGAEPSAPGATVKRFVRPMDVTDKTFMISSDSLASGSPTSQPLDVYTAYTYDGQGNPTQTTVGTSAGAESYVKTITNVYGDPGSQEERLGKVTVSTVTTQRSQPMDCLSAPITHTTKYVYGEVNRFASPLVENVMVGTLGLKETIVEPGAGAPIELHTAYEYDRFGNVTKTTACASDFESCGQPGVAGSADLPYRITQVSYDPADFKIPAGTGRTATLSYGAGRYPVKTTNGAGHTEFTAYDPRFGTLVQQTGPNGISTCEDYDGLGRQTSEITRCGSGKDLVTLTRRFLTNSSLAPKVVTETVPPAGSPTWNYTDALGRNVMTIGLAFAAEFTKTLTFYDNLGRVSATTKPFLAGTADFTVTSDARQTVTHYDAVGRVASVVDDLGVLDGTGSATTPVSSTVTTTYQGTTVTTTRTVNGETRTRSETKNALGKLASVTDAQGVTLSFSYDADGHMTDTASPQDVCAPPAGAVKVMHIVYDGRGRKQTSHDPDLGDWGYEYNGFGDLVRQTDAKGRPTNMTYDTLGRMVQRDDDDGTALWIYDAAPHGIGKLAAMVSPSDPRLGGSCQVEFAPPPAAGQNQAGRSYHYTAFGDLEETTECADGTSFVTTHGYDDFGRPNLLRYPDVKGNRFAVDYAYTESGYLRYVADDADGKVLWAVKGMDAMGQVTDEQLRNGVETQSVRNHATGWLLGRTSVSHADSDAIIQQWAFGFDEAGNLRARQRTDAVNGADATETFGYDAIDRLLSSTVQIPSEQGYNALEQYDFDAGGNLTTKSGKSYHYGTGCMAGNRAAGPHALCQIDSGPTYNYDGNGNLLSVGDRSVTWNASNKAARLISGTGAAAKTADFIYGADGQRVVEVIGTGDGLLGSSSNTTASRTVYVGLGDTGKSLYERTTRGNKVEHAHFIYAGMAHGGSAFAIRKITEDTSSPSAPVVTDDEYRHFDHLGSVTAVSDSAGQVASAAWAGPAASIFSYDPWGARRNPDGSAADASAFALPAGNRGFTDQESVPTLDLVNMNGRIYDPAVGRFLSADPTTQFPSDLQSYNRYSYAAGNPLRYTDPTGYSSHWQTAFEQGVGVAIGLVSVAVCGSTANPELCAAGFALISATMSTTAAISAGAPWDQAVLTSLLGVGFGYTFGALGGPVGQEIVQHGGGQMLGAAIGGAIGGGVLAAVMTPVTGGNLGYNVLEGAVLGAFEAGVAAGTQNTSPVSQAAAAAGGGDADRVDRLDDDQPSEAEKAALRANRNHARAMALSHDEFNDFDINGVPFRVLGETAVDRGQVIQEAERVLNTEHGRDLLVRTAASLSEGERFEIVLTDRGGSFSGLGFKNSIVVDINDLHRSYGTVVSSERFTMTRILAHEFGHSMGGVRDFYSTSDASGVTNGAHMTNIQTWENPIMRELGDTLDRVSYTGL